MMIQILERPERPERPESLGNPGHGSDHTACGTPNPPWWCEGNAPTVDINMYIVILLIIAIGIAVYFIIKNKQKGKPYKY